MPAKTQGEKIDALNEIAASLQGSQRSTEKDINRLEQRLSEIDSRLSSLENRVGVLDHQIQDLWEGRKEFYRRLWMIAGPIVAAILGFVLRGCIPAN